MGRGIQGLKKGLATVVVSCVGVFVLRADRVRPLVALIGAKSRSPDDFLSAIWAAEMRNTPLRLAQCVH
jgi:hypothetical protein